LSPDPADTAQGPPAAALLRDRWLLGLLALGLVLRMALVVWLDPAMELRADEKTYDKVTEAWLATGEFDTGIFVRPPLFFVWIAGQKMVADVFGLDWRLLAKLMQCVLGTVAALFVYRSAYRLGGRLAARIGAGLLLLDPTLIAYGHLLWPETLYLFLTAAIFDLMATAARPTLLRALVMGALIGIAMLTKPVIGLFAPFLAGFWLLRFRGAGFVPVAVVAVAALLVIAPWVRRNTQLYGYTILLENQGPYNLWAGNSSEPGHVIVSEWFALWYPKKRSQVAFQKGVDAIAADPALFTRRSVSRALNLWGLEYFVVRHVILGGYGEVGRGALLSTFWIIQAGYVLALLAAALGLRAAWADPVLRAILIYALVFTGLVAVMVATTRFRVPFGFILAVAGGLGVSRAVARGLVRADFAWLGIAIVLLALSASRPIFRTIGAGNYETVREVRNPEWNWFRY
jgi:4-amino-4-deoxy-L-arabinose transferase-like glycosyltransferase